MLLTQKQHECANQRKHAHADSEAVRLDQQVVVDQHDAERGWQHDGERNQENDNPGHGGLTPSRASSATRGASLSAEEVKKAVEPYGADQDEIDRNNIVQQPRHEQNQDAAGESNERHQMMGDGGQPHGGVSSFFGLNYRSSPRRAQPAPPHFKVQLHRARSYQP